MEQKLPFKRKSEFQHISELLPKAAERILNRAEDPMPDPNNPKACIEWIDKNL